MTGARWDEARDALAWIAEEALKPATDGVDLRFFNSPQICLGVKVCPCVFLHLSIFR